jgi:hypothetical protein
VYSSVLARETGLIRSRLNIFLRLKFGTPSKGASAMAGGGAHSASYRSGRSGAPAADIGLPPRAEARLLPSITEHRSAASAEHSTQKRGFFPLFR